MAGCNSRRPHKLRRVHGPGRAGWLAVAAAAMSVFAGGQSHASSAKAAAKKAAAKEAASTSASASSSAAASAKVTGVRFWSLGEVTRVAIEVSSEFQFKS